MSVVNRQAWLDESVKIYSFLNSKTLENIVRQVQEHCQEILRNGQAALLPFHNLVHTEEVVQNAKLILKEEEIFGHQREIVLIAAWFHDTGFNLKYDGHEDESISLAKEFLQIRNYQEKDIDQVIDCIAATKMPQHPGNHLAEVLCDADLFHLSSPNFFYRKLLLRKEWENQLNKRYSDLEWHILNLNFLESHRYFTLYGRNILSKGLEENFHKVNNLIKVHKSGFQFV